jgi:hypothetical protein
MMIMMLMMMMMLIGSSSGGDAGGGGDCGDGDYDYGGGDGDGDMLMILCSQEEAGDCSLAAWLAAVEAQASKHGVTDGWGLVLVRVR